jgi:hypothetical protein
LWEGLTEWNEHTNDLIEQLLDFDAWSPDEVSPFRVAFSVEAVQALSIAHGAELSDRSNRSLSWAVEYLTRSIMRHNKSSPVKEYRESDSDLTYAQKGAANMRGYPPTAFLTQLVLRTLLRAGSLKGACRQDARDWAARQMDHELALVIARSQSADFYALAYSVMSFAMLSRMSDLTPPEKQIVSAAVAQVFAAQLEDGSWPQSRPLHHDPQLGNSYCYESEMLTQLLTCEPLGDYVVLHVENLERAFRYLESTKYEIADNSFGWASGHHRLLSGPESWSTAAAYHFMHLLERVLAEEIRKSVFSHLRARYRSPTAGGAEYSDFAKKSEFLDAPLYYREEPLSLREEVLNRFLKRIAHNSENVRRGLSLPSDLPMSMLMFGPPGTSKTQLARMVSDFLGWPLLAINPSHILSDGWDRIHAQAISLFDRIEEIDSTVVFLDEFDELFKARTTADADAVSRFFTTALLPELAEINATRRVVLLLATNHIDKFDDAITRRGRFDVIVQVLPPTREDKFWKWPNLKTHLHNEKVKITKELTQYIEAFTFQEMDDLSNEVTHQSGVQEILETIERRHLSCTLNQLIGDAERPSTTWRDVCVEQRKFIRLPETYPI